MRQILTKNPFSTTLKGLITAKTEELETSEKIYSLQFDKQLKRILLDEESQKKKLKKHIRKYEEICLAGEKPVETILKYFMENCRKYNDSFMAETLCYVSKAYDIIGKDCEGTADRYGYRMYEDTYFDHLITQLKFGLQESSYISEENLIKVLESMESLRYVDMEVINLVIKKIEKVLEIYDGQEMELKYFQIEKKGYYQKQFYGLQQALLKDEIFLKNIERVEKIEKKIRERRAELQSIPQEENEAQGYETIYSLIKSIHEMNDSIEQFVKAIINVRQQYYRMCKISEEEVVLRDPSLNTDLLQIQELLLQTELISIKDVQNPRRINIKEDEINEVEKIIRTLLKKNNVPFQEEYLHSQQKNKNDKRQTKKDTGSLAKIIYALAKYASLPYNLYGHESRLSLINSKWQKFILGYDVPESYIAADRIYRKAFAHVHKFFKKNLTILEYNFLSLPFDKRVFWLNALSIMGIGNHSYLPLKNLKLTEKMIGNLPNQETLLLLSILNDYGNQLSISNSFQESLTNRIIEFVIQHLEEGKVISMHHQCMLLNYLYQYQHIKDNPEIQKTYNKLIQILQNQVSVMENNRIFHKKEINDAYMILFFENQKQSIESLVEFGSEREEQERWNPYKRAIERMCEQYSKKHQTLPLYFCGFNQKGQQTAIHIVDSDHCSLDGFIYGSVRAFKKRVLEKFNIDIHLIPINSFIDVNYEKKILKLKDKDQIVKQIKSLFSTNLKLIIKSTETLSSAILNSKQLPKLKAKVLLNSLNNIVALVRFERECELLSQSLGKKYELLIALQKIEKLFESLKQDEKKNLEREELNINQIIQEMKEQVNKYLKASKQLKEVPFEGKRTTLQLLDSEPSKNFAPETELIDYTYYLDKQYGEYSDWINTISETNCFQSIPLDSTSSTIQLLAKKFLPEIQNSLELIPLKSEKKFVLSPYPLDWRNHYLSHVNNSDMTHLEQLSKDFCTVESTKTSSLLSQVLNFKHQLKMTKSPSQLCEYIFGFEFFNESMTPKGKISGKHIQRDAKSYFKFLETKSLKQYLESPHLSYIFNKLAKIQSFKNILNTRDDIRIQYRMFYRKGMITNKQYFKKMKEVDQQTIKKMKKLNFKVLAHVSQNQIGQDSAKMVQITTDLKQLEKIMMNYNYYDHELDEDFINAGGNHQQALKVKRNKAYINLLKLRLLYKIGKNEKLTEKDNLFLQKWKSGENMNKLQFDLIIQDLSSEDKKKLQLKHSNLNYFKNIYLSEILLEFETFFDKSILQYIDNRVEGEKLIENIPKEFFSISRNKELKKYAGEKQQQMFFSEGIFDQRELNYLKQMTEVFKTEAHTGKKRYKDHYEEIDKDIKSMNQSVERKEAIWEYLRLKDEEFYQDYNPKLVQEHKKNVVSQLWIRVFRSQMNKTKQKDILRGVEEIILRLVFLKQNTPPYFGKLVLAILHHPETDRLSKQKLLAYLALFRINLEIDSTDVLSLTTKYKIRSELPSLLREACRKDFTEYAFQRIHEL